MEAPQPPNDAETEMALLGAILLNRDALTTVAPLVRADDFYIRSHQHIYAAMLALAQQHQPPDIRLVAAHLKMRQQIESIGGMTYLLKLSDMAVTSYHAPNYARVVRDLAWRRRVIDAGSRIAAIGYQEPDAAECYAQASVTLTSANTVNASGGWMPIGDVLNGIYDQMQTGTPRGLMTGLYDLDRILGGLHPGDLTILAGRPGHGKTTAAMTIANEIAHQQHAPVLFDSLEMAREELVQRLLAMHTGISANKQRRMALAPDEIDTLTAAMARLGDMPLHIDDDRSVTISDLRSRALAAAHRLGGIALLIVDYLQLVTARIDRGMTTSYAIGEVSRGLKRLARELEAPVLALSQLNRENDRRTGNVPQLSDLRESGDIEADADHVVFVVRHELYEPDEPKYHNVAHLYVQKNRHGPTGIAVVGFDGAATALRNMTTYRTPEGYDYAANDYTR